MFVTGNNDGSVSLFDGSQLIKTKKLNGISTYVAYSNGQIVAAAKNGNLTIMNEQLALIKEFVGIEAHIRSISGNETHLATCDTTGSVCYYKISNVESKVVFQTFEYSRLLDRSPHSFTSV